MEYIFDWKENINEKELKRVIEVIKSDGIVLVPTETVYGIAANALSDEACQRVFIAKDRAADNPLIVHVSDKEMIKRLVNNITEIEEKLIDTFMPGPFTLILENNNSVCQTASAGNSSIGIRMPSNNIINKIISVSRIPLAAPSANISGRPSGTCLEDIFDELKNKVDCIIDGGKCKIGIESTVVKVVDGVPIILRPGFITENDIEKAIGKVAFSDHLFTKVDEDEMVESPGMKYKHYAPKTKCILVEYGENHIEEINKIIAKNEDVCVMGFSEDKKYINTDKYIDVGSKYNLDEIAQNIFSALRSIDKQNCKLAIIEGVKKEGLGLSIMNRLVRACENKIIKEGDKDVFDCRIRKPRARI